MLFRDRAIIRLDTVDSTNNYAANLIKLSTPPDGTVITAQEQTHGKGQRGAAWVAHKGENLLSSIIVYPQVLDSTNMFVLSQATALACKETFESFCDKDVMVKWPNDIYVDSKKLGGILIEYNWVESKIQSAIIGMGLNINQGKFENPKATSLRNIIQKHTPVDQFLEKLLERFEHWYLKLQSRQFDIIRNEYFMHLFKRNEMSIYNVKGNIMKARITNVSNSGLLQLEDENGQSFEAEVKEIQFIL